MPGTFTQSTFTRSASRIALFAALAYMIDYSYQLVDIFWIARLGPGYPTAIAIVSSLFALIMAANEIAGAGTVSVFSQAAGARDPRSIGHVIRQAIVMKFTLGAMMALAFGIAILFALPLFTTDPLITGHIHDYASIIWLSLVIVPVQATMMTALRSNGHEGITVPIAIMALVANAALNPLFIFGAGPVPAMGMAGAAWASIAAQALALLAAATALCRAQRGLRLFEFSQLKPDRPLWRKIIAIGLPIGGVLALYNLEQTVLTAIMASYPAEISDGYGIASRISGLLFMGVYGISTGVSIASGMRIGAQDATTVQQRLPPFALQAGLLAALVCLPAALGGEWTMRQFTANETTIATGALYLRFMIVIIALACVLHSFAGAFEGSGRTLPVLAVHAAMYLAIEVPAVLAAHHLFGAGPMFIWMTVSVSMLFGAVMMAALFTKGYWRADVQTA